MAFRGTGTRDPIFLKNNGKVKSFIVLLSEYSGCVQAKSRDNILKKFKKCASRIELAAEGAWCGS